MKWDYSIFLERSGMSVYISKEAGLFYFYEHSNLQKFTKDSVKIMGCDSMC